MNENPLQLQDLVLKDGTNVTISYKTKFICKCGAECWRAVTHKNKKLIKITLVGLAEWGVHECLKKE